MANNVTAGQVALTGSPQQLTAILGSAEYIMLVNPGANIIYIGHDNTVDPTTGYALMPGEQLRVEILNGFKLWIDGTAADRLGWMAVKP